MRPIPPHLRQQIDSDPYYKVCARKSDGGCDGRITIEHAIIHAGKQLNEPFALLPLCTYHHAVNEHQDGKGLDKRKNEYLALMRATDTELEAISKAKDYKQYREYLKGIYD